MPVNDTTTNRGYQKPNIANTLADDVGRLRSALDSIDTDMVSKAPTAGPTFTGVTTVAAGSAGAPSLTFTGATSDTGIYSPGADQVAISTAGTGRLFVDASGRVSIGESSPVEKLEVRDGNIGLDSAGSAVSDRTTERFYKRTDNGSVNGMAAIGMNGVGTNGFLGEIKFYTGTSDVYTTALAERMRLDSSGRLLVGTSTALSSLAKSVEVANPIAISAYINNAFTYALQFAKSRGSSNGTIVQNGDELGKIQFFGDDGTTTNVQSARIDCFVDGTPGTNDMPGRIVLSVTADGASSPTEQWRINNAGTVIYNQPAPAAVDTTATLTVANLTAKIITSTTAAAVTMTLPTGTLMDGGFSGLYNNMAFEWSVINTGATNAVTVQGGTGHTVVGSGTVAASNSGRFLSRRTAATTWVTYRLSS